MPGAAVDVLRLKGGADTAWAEFDPEWYLARHPDARFGVQPDDPDAVLHFYLVTGQQIGHSPNRWFDEAWYLRLYPDAATAIEEGIVASGFDEYCRAGHTGRSPHWLYDDWLYTYLHKQASGEDLTGEFLAAAGFANRYDHYLHRGSRTGRMAHLLFDPAHYRAQLDATEAAASDAIGAFAHYLHRIEAGGPEPPTSPYFDPDWYRRTYPEVAAAIGSTWLCALHHYLANDTPTAFDPLPEFSEAFYLERHPDVAATVAEGGLRNGYRHFLTNGVFELRPPDEMIDLREYVAQHAQVRADLEAGVVRDAFAHLLRFRIAPTAHEPDEEARAKAVFRTRARNLLPILARRPIDFRTSAPPVVSVIMAVRDNFALTLQALASLRDNSPAPMEVIVVDGGSSDETRHLERYVLGARVLRFDSNLGFLRASNAALIGASADTVLYLNNDVELAPGAVVAALERLASDARIGAVGAKIIRSHGRLHEAGGIVWRDGMTLGYMRDASPLAPEVNFVRDVDYCSAAFLMVRAAPLRALEGFDDAFAPAYYEETDLCVRLRQAGHRVVYDPSVVITHLEYASSRDGELPVDQLRRSQRVFFRKHLNWLRFQHVQDAKAQVFARSTVRDARRLLFIEDTVPLRMIGSGFVRSNDLVRAIAALGWQVTVYPVNEAQLDPAAVYADFPDTVEVMYDRSLGGLEVFLQDRAGYYDTFWIARTHNLDRVKPVLERTVGANGPMPRCVLDTEAIGALRGAERARLDAEAAAFDVDAAIMREFGNAHFCQNLVAVNEHEAQTLRTLGFSDVSVIGHVREVALTPRAWQDRSGLLFIGAIHVMDSPNYDGLCWFVDQVLPIVELALGWETRLTVVGYTAEGVTLERFRGHPRVTLRGVVANTRALYDAHRVFVAPTRYSAGMPYKVHEAASFGVPVVASELLRRQLGWDNGKELLSADVMDPEEFARHVVALYRSEELWLGVRRAAAERLRQENDPARYRDLLAGILGDPPAPG